jgi:hypothetical protein
MFYNEPHVQDDILEMWQQCGLLVEYIERTAVIDSGMLMTA